MAGERRIEGGRRTRGSATVHDGVRPLVTVVTAVLNGAHTIKRTIDSVLDQEYPNIEYIVIDGGSTDGTVEILAKHDNDLAHWISEPDRGIYDALNKGIDLAQGEWLYFLGADDRLADADVISGIFSRPLRSHMLYGNVIWGTTGALYGGEFSKTRLYYCNICHQAIFYHRNVFRRLGKFDLTYPLLADWVLNLKAFASREIDPVFVDRVVAFYSASGASATAVDRAFAAARGALIRKHFGLRRYLHYRFLYGPWLGAKERARALGKGRA